MTSFLLSTVAFSVVSQSLMDASILLLFFSLIFHHYKAHKFEPLKPNILRKPYLFEIGFILYILAVAAGLFYYNVDLNIILKSLSRFNWIINLYIFYWYFNTSKPSLKTIVWFFILGFLVSNLYAIASFVFNFDFILNDELKDRRVIGILKSATYHAHGNALILSFFFTYIFYHFKNLDRKTKILYSIAVLFMILSILFTLTRGPILSLIIVFLAFMYKHSKKGFIISALTCLFAFTIMYTQTDLVKKRVSQTVDKSQIDNIRVNLFKVHVKMIEDSPLIGIGYSSPLNHTRGWWHTLNLPENYFDSHAHNQLLNVWATTGLFGLIPFCIFYFWFFIKNVQLVKIFRDQKNSELYYIAVACLATQSEYIIANFTDIGFEYSKIRTLILIVWALVLSLWKNQKESLAYDNK